jgi:hypothetical protein
MRTSLDYFLFPVDFHFFVMYGNQYDKVFFPVVFSLRAMYGSLLAAMLVFLSCEFSLAKFCASLLLLMFEQVKIRFLTTCAPSDPV